MQKIVTILAVFLMMFSVSFAEAQRWVESSNDSRSSNSRYNRRPSANAASRGANSKLAAIAPEAETPSGGNTFSKNQSALSKTQAPADLVKAELTHPRNHVLLIGVNDYPVAEPSTDITVSLRLSDLQFCRKDMEELKKALVQARFCREENIQLLISGAGGTSEPTYRNLSFALNNIVDNVAEGDRILVAFSGHGVSLPVPREKDTEDYLCLADAHVVYNADAEQFESRRGIYARHQLEEKLGNSKAGTKLVFIDACRNVLDDMTGIVKGGTAYQKGVATLRSAMNNFGNGVVGNVTGKGLFRFSSCTPGESSHEYMGDINHGIFTYFLIRGMLGEAPTDPKRNNLISLQDLYEYVSDETSAFVQENVSTESSPASQSPVLVSVPFEANVRTHLVPFSFANYDPNEDLNESATSDNDLNMAEIAAQEEKEREARKQQAEADKRRFEELVREEVARQLLAREAEQSADKRRELADIERRAQDALNVMLRDFSDRYAALNRFASETQTQLRTLQRSRTENNQMLAGEHSHIIEAINVFNADKPQGTLTLSAIESWNSIGSELQQRAADWKSSVAKSQRYTANNAQPTRNGNPGFIENGGNRTRGIR